MNEIDCFEFYCIFLPHRQRQILGFVIIRLLVDGFLNLWNSNFIHRITNNGLGSWLAICKLVVTTLKAGLRPKLSHEFMLLVLSLSINSGEKCLKLTRNDSCLQTFPWQFYLFSELLPENC